VVTQIKSYTDTSDCTLLDNICYCPIRPACFGYSIKPSLDIIIKIRKTSSSSVQEVKQSHYRSGQVLVEGESRRCQDNRHMKVVRLSTVSTGRLYPPPPRKYSLYSFLLEAESTPGPQCGRKDCHRRESNPRPSGLKRSVSPNCATPYMQVPGLRIMLIMNSSKEMAL
jgi:hypothetical protein